MGLSTFYYALPNHNREGSSSVIWVHGYGPPKDVDLSLMKRAWTKVGTNTPIDTIRLIKI